MSNKLKLSVGFIALSFLQVSLTPWALIAVVFSFMLFAFVVWTEIYTENQIQRINSEIQGLKDKISALQLSKGMGR